jgi:tRNA threonylcarbamoyladenosine biosynthesis protein TsaB
MNLLAIETSSTACSTAILVNGEKIVLHREAPLQQAQMILSMVEEIFETSKLSINQLDAIAFGCGPGSFTGVRIATSVAQGLGYAAKLPLIPISSLAGLAQAAFMDLGWKKLIVAVDARIQEVYCGAYEADADGIVRLVGQEQVCPPQQMSFPTQSDWHGVGNAWEIYKQDIQHFPAKIDATRSPAALGILRLAEANFASRVKPEYALPTYLRDKVAYKPGEKKG